MKPVLSVVVPAIRPYNWKRLYDSIVANCKYDFELILIGPYSLSSELEQYKNIKIIRDFGSPSRCMNIGASIAEGEYITWGADDGIVINDGFTKCMDIAIEGHIITAKYTEHDDIVHKDEYYQLNKAYPYSPHITNDWWIFNLAFMPLGIYKTIGGCDAMFHVSCVALADLAVRTQRYSGKTILFADPIMKFDWITSSVPGSDHLPIELAQANQDWPLYTKIHNEEKDRMFVDFDNWKQSPSVWKERFGDA